MIEIGPGIVVYQGITIGDVDVFGTQFVEENGTDYLISEIGQNFIEE